MLVELSVINNTLTFAIQIPYLVVFGIIVLIFILVRRQ